MTHTYNSSTHEAEAVDYPSLRPHSEYQANQCYKWQDTVSNNDNKQTKLQQQNTLWSLKEWDGVLSVETKAGSIEATWEVGAGGV